MNRALSRWSLASVFVLVSIALAPAPATAGCKMNVYVKNTGTYDISIINDKNDTGVKTQGGTWRKLSSGDWKKHRDRIRLSPGEETGDQYNADFGCGNKRRLRVRYICLKTNPPSFTDYYPAANSWSTQQTIYIRLTQCK